MTYLLIFIPMLLVAMTFHEAAHALMGYWLGDHTAKHEGRLSLNPLVHIDPIFTVLVPAIMIALGQPPILAAKPVPFNPRFVKYGEYGSAMIALAGPLANILLAMVTAIFISFLNEGIVYEIMVFFMRLNISLAVFNLIPWPPLDGSRVLYALVPESVQRFMNQIESMGIMGLFLFIFLAWRFVGPLVGAIESFFINTLL